MQGNFGKVNRIFKIYVVFIIGCYTFEGFPRWHSVKKKKNPPVNAGDASSVPGSGIYPKVGNGNLLQYSCLENSMERGVW